MKINFTTINSIPKLKLKYDINNITGLQPLKLDSVHMEPRYQPINVLLQEIVGEYSKEDINIINKTIKTYENNPDIKNLHIAAVEEITRIFKSITDLKSISGADTKNIELFSFSPTNVSYEIKQKLKKAGITAYALNNLLHRNNIKAFQPSYDYWFNTKYKNQNSKIAQSMYQHLRDKGIFITGNLIGEEIQNVQKYEYMYNSLDINEIFNKKIKILNTLSKYLSQPESDFTGTFSNRELKIIKNNIIQYDALNNIQKKRGIFTKYLEQLLFASEMNQNIKPGNYVPGIGLITDKIFVNKKPVVIAFSTNEKYHNLKMYDLSKTTRGNEFLSTIDNISNCSELNKLNSAAKNIIDREWETVVSEIQFVPKELTEKWGINLGSNLTFQGAIFPQPHLFFNQKEVNPENGRFRTANPLKSGRITNTNIFYVYDKNDNKIDHTKLFIEIMKICKEKNFIFSNDFHPNRVKGYAIENTNV